MRSNPPFTPAFLASLLLLLAAAASRPARAELSVRGAISCLPRVLGSLLDKSVEAERKKAILESDLRTYTRTVAETGEAARYGKPEGFIAETQARLESGAKSEDELIDELDAFMSAQGGTGWYHSLVPRELFRKVGLLRNNVMKDVYGDGHLTLQEKPSFLTLWERQVAQGGVEAAKGYVDALADAVDARAKELDRVEASGEKDDTGFERPSKAVLRGLCAQQSLRHSGKCLKALEQILAWMDPLKVELPMETGKVSQYVTMRGQLAGYLKDLTNLRAVERLASKVWDWVADPQALHDRDVFSALKAEYLSLGLDEREATERCWEFMGIYSTRGANIGETIEIFAQGYGGSAPGAFSVIAHGMGILDARALARGAPMFSYPKGVSTTIDNAKPYHFWMSAYLARKTAQLTGSPEAGRDAAWIAQLGYQMRSVTDGRDPSRAFHTGAFDLPNNKIRMDLSYAAAGATYGARSAAGGPPPALSIDEGFKYLVKQGKPVGTLKPEAAAAAWSGFGAEGYLRWQRIFSPDAVLRFYESNRH